MCSFTHPDQLCLCCLLNGPCFSRNRMAALETNISLSLSVNEPLQFLYSFATQLLSVTCALSVVTSGAADEVLLTTNCEIYTRLQVMHFGLLFSNCHQIQYRFLFLYFPPFGAISFCHCCSCFISLVSCLYLSFGLHIDYLYITSSNHPSGCPTK